MIQAKYKEEKAKVQPVILAANHKHTTSLLAIMSDVLGEYSRFFRQGEKILDDITSDLGAYTDHIEKVFRLAQFSPR